MQNLIGIRTAVARDPEWQTMKKAWDACTEAGATVPEVVRKFFGDQPPTEGGGTVDLDGHMCVRQVNAPNQSGIEVDLAKLPDGVTKLRFVNSR